MNLPERMAAIAGQEIGTIEQEYEPSAEYHALMRLNRYVSYKPDPEDAVLKDIYAVAAEEGMKVRLIMAGNFYTMDYDVKRVNIPLELTDEERLRVHKPPYLG
jgi:hypothetical protein